MPCPALFLLILLIGQVDSAPTAGHMIKVMVSDLSNSSDASEGGRELDLVPGSSLFLTHQIKLVPSSPVPDPGPGTCGCEPDFTLLLERLERLEKEVSTIRGQCGASSVEEGRGGGVTPGGSGCSTKPEDQCPNQCGNKGRCQDGRCVCSPGFTGPDCSDRTCPQSCHQRGRCVAGACICDPGFTGDNCSEEICPGNCSDRGRCVSGRCSCDPGFSGLDCSEKSCPSNCSDRGRCVAGICACDRGFAGEDCSEKLCPRNCNNRGRCEKGRCVCSPDFSGLDCSKKGCPRNCSGHGRCVGVGKCVCNRGFSGPDCSEKTCPRNCNNRGRCVGGQCVCDAGFAGADCSVSVCPNDCKDRGRCLKGRCICQTGFSGLDCGQCVEGMTGPLCDTVMSGVSQLKSQDITETSATLVWTQPPLRYDTYVITLNSQEDGEPRLSAKLDGTQTSFTQTGLAAGQKYSATISGEIDGRRGAESSTEFYTSIPSPSNLQLVDSTSTTVIVQWEEPRGEIDRYRVTVTRGDGAGPSQNIEVPAGQNSAHINQLEVGHIYDIILVAEKEEEKSGAVSSQSVPGSASSWRRLSAPLTLQVSLGSKGQVGNTDSPGLTPSQVVDVRNQWEEKGNEGETVGGTPRDPATSAVTERKALVSPIPVRDISRPALLRRPKVPGSVLRRVPHHPTNKNNKAVVPDVSGPGKRDLVEPSTKVEPKASQVKRPGSKKDQEQGGFPGLHTVPKGTGPHAPKKCLDKVPETHSSRMQTEIRGSGCSRDEMVGAGDTRGPDPDSAETDRTPRDPEQSADLFPKLLMDTYRKLNVSTFSVHLSKGAKLPVNADAAWKTVFTGLKPLTSFSSQPSSSSMSNSPPPPSSSVLRTPKTPPPSSPGPLTPSLMTHSSTSSSKSQWSGQPSWSHSSSLDPPSSLSSLSLSRLSSLVSHTSISGSSDPDSSSPSESSEPSSEKTLSQSSSSSLISPPSSSSSSVSQPSNFLPPELSSALLRSGSLEPSSSSSSTVLKPLSRPLTSHSAISPSSLPSSRQLSNSEISGSSDPNPPLTTSPSLSILPPPPQTLSISAATTPSTSSPLSSSAASDSLLKRDMVSPKQRQVVPSSGERRRPLPQTPSRRGFIRRPQQDFGLYRNKTLRRPQLLRPPHANIIPGGETSESHPVGRLSPSEDQAAPSVSESKVQTERGRIPFQQQFPQDEYVRPGFPNLRTLQNRTRLSSRLWSRRPKPIFSRPEVQTNQVSSTEKPASPLTPLVVQVTSLPQGPREDGFKKDFIAHTFSQTLEGTIAPSLRPLLTNIENIHRPQPSGRLAENEDGLNVQGSPYPYRGNMVHRPSTIKKPTEGTRSPTGVFKSNPTDLIHLDSSSSVGPETILSPQLKNVPALPVESEEKNSSTASPVALGTQPNIGENLVPQLQPQPQPQPPFVVHNTSSDSRHLRPASLPKRPHSPRNVSRSRYFIGNQRGQGSKPERFPAPGRGAALKPLMRSIGSSPGVTREHLNPVNKAASGQKPASNSSQGRYPQVERKEAQTKERPMQKEHLNHLDSEDQMGNDQDVPLQDARIAITQLKPPPHAPQGQQEKDAPPGPEDAGTLLENDPGLLSKLHNLLISTGPEPPTNIFFSELTENSVKVSWTKPKSPVDGFRVTYTNTQDGEPASVSLDSGASSVVLSQLSPGSAYDITVVSTLGAEDSGPVHRRLKTLPDPPTNLRVANITNSGALVLWRRGVADADQYTIVYRSGPGSELRIQVSGGVAQQELHDLWDSTNYTVIITSQWASLHSSPASTSFTTSSANETAAPRDLQASRVTPRTALLSWKPPKGPVAGYRLTYQADGHDKKEVKLTSSVTEFNLTRLFSGSQYSVHLQAESGGGYSTAVSTEFTTGVLRFPFPTDCSQELLNGVTKSGEVDIFPRGRQGALLTVYCDMETDGGGWTVFQRRRDGSVNFFRRWSDYVQGFGDLSGEFWLGLENLHVLTSATRMSLRVDLRDGDQRAFADYSRFQVSQGSYRLTVGGYSGTAGDSLSYHNNHVFSTKDHDRASLLTRCAVSYMGGWWYRNCHQANLNGLYDVHVQHQGVIWTTWKGKNFSIPFTEMKMRPTVFTAPHPG